MSVESVADREETPNRLSIILGSVVVLTALAMAIVMPAAARGTPPSSGTASPTLTEIDDQTQPRLRTIDNPGDLKMFVYVPESVRLSPQPRPLVVALHGCAMSAEDYFLPTGWAQLAEQWSFALLLPQQKKPNPYNFDFLKGKNNTAVCFSWWEADRGNVEVRSIMSMIRILLDQYGSSLDPGRIYVTGVSAGGAMTVDLLALYPACFAAGAPIAGIPFNCSDGSPNQAVNDCMKPTTAPGPQPRSVDEGGKGYPAEKWGKWVRRVCGDNGDCPSNERGWPRITIWQGAQDRMVGPGNMRDLRRQWTYVHGIDEVADHRVTRRARPYEVEHKEYADRSGRVLVETWLVGKQGPATDHGVVIDPEEATFVCGRTQNFIFDGNICSTLQIARFWGLDPYRPAEAGRAGGRCAALQ